MIAKDLLRFIREQMCSEIRLRETTERGVSVAVPLTFGDGDLCRVFVQPQGDETYKITDGGHVIAIALMEGVDLLSAGHAERFRRVAAFYGAVEASGALTSMATADKVGDAVFSFIQACLETSKLADLPPEGAKKRTEFSRKFQGLVQHILGGPSLQRNWHDLERDPKKAFRVDFRIGNSSQNFLLFGVGNGGKCWKSVAAAQHYRLRSLPRVRSVFAYADTAKVDESAFAAMTENADHSFSFEHQKREFQDFLRAEVRVE